MARKTTTKKTTARKAPTKEPATKTLIQVSESDAATLQSARERAEARVTQMGRLRMQILALQDQEASLRVEVATAHQNQTAMIETVAMKYKIDLTTETWEFVFGDNIFRRIG